MPSLSSLKNSQPQTIRAKSPKTQERRPCIVKAIAVLSSQGKLREAVKSLDLLRCHGLRLDSRTLASLLQQCANTRSLREGKWLHLHLKLTGFRNPTTFLANHLINMYSKCGNEALARKVFDKMSGRNLYSWNNMLSGYAKLGMMKPAQRLFDKMPEKDVVSWNTMVIACGQLGFYDEALRFYRKLRASSLGYNAFSFAGVLTVCVKLRDVELTRQVHGQILVTGFVSNVVLSSSVVDAYTKCGEMGDARRLFDGMPVRDVLSWTTMVSGYAKWGDMKSALELFDKMPKKNPVSWTALISGYSRNGMGHKALDLFSKMMILHISPNQFTFSSCLSACASIAALKHGKQIHAYLIRANFRPNTIVVSSLIDMYSKCGTLGLGKCVFYGMGNKQDVVLWNTMISALAQYGCGKEAVQMFDDMVISGVKPNKISLVLVLQACSCSGFVLDGLRIFESMTCDHGMVPDQELCACLIDLFSRAGCFNEVMSQLKNIHFKPDHQVWNAILDVCRIQGNLEVGRKAAEHLIELEPQSPAAYVLLSSIYAVLGKEELVARVRQLMNERNVKKERPISWIEIENEVHAFFVLDSLHRLKEEIYSVLEQLAGQMEEDVSLTNIE
ncbi:pentatricopeptide repeat-containing protein At2g21090 [Malania oleifera]|uniref:pentatricopeptide repeat-containing protein At2g21090 n=1 Tax=Malania oleifera TaxID=397392 RepID=UPI0025AE33E7|nr:pentatricopeptide repeat-containing protein At2g21090 [Malania oleifera]